MENLFNKLSISDSVYTNCSYCNKPFTEESWCKECDPYRIMEGWTSGNSDIDKFIKDTIRKKNTFLEWIPFDRFTDIKKIGEGGFSKVYSATWIDGKSKFKYDNGSFKKREPTSMKVALKKLNESQNMSDTYLNKIKVFWKLFGSQLHGFTKDPETEEFMIVMCHGERSLRSRLSEYFNFFQWKDRINCVCEISRAIIIAHSSGYFHKNLHSGNIICNDHDLFVSDFGLSGPANESNSDDEVYGVLPYIAPEVLSGEPYTLSSDIYSFGVVMAEISFGKPPFYNKKHDLNLVSAICNGLRPEFGNGTPEFYKKLAYKCMDVNPKERPTAEKLFNEIRFWPMFRYNEYKKAIERADNERFKFRGLYDKDSDDAIYTSRRFIFSNLLPKSVNNIPYVDIEKSKKGIFY